MNDPDVGYVRLALAILMQAIRDARAPRTTRRSGLIQPTPRDVRSAREFLTSPAAMWLAARLGLSPEHVRRLIGDTSDAETGNNT